MATVLYDFHADGHDELTVNEGDQLTILLRDGDDWWKCRNAHGVEGVVPASYLEVTVYHHFCLFELKNVTVDYWGDGESNRW